MRVVLPTEYWPRTSTNGFASAGRNVRGEEGGRGRILGNLTIYGHCSSTAGAGECG